MPRLPHAQPSLRPHVRAILGVLLVGWLLLAATTPALAAEPITVGATISLEGRFRDMSAQMQVAMRLWERQVNENGGLLGCPVRLLLYDDKSDPVLARALYAKLLDDDKLDLLAAPYGRLLTKSAAEVSDS